LRAATGTRKDTGRAGFTQARCPANRPRKRPTRGPAGAMTAMRNCAML